jgi:hypothetical protein
MRCFWCVTDWNDTESHNYINEEGLIKHTRDKHSGLNACSYDYYNKREEEIISIIRSSEEELFYYFQEAYKDTGLASDKAREFIKFLLHELK